MKTNDYDIPMGSGYTTFQSNSSTSVNQLTRVPKVKNKYQSNMQVIQSQTTLYE